MKNRLTFLLTLVVLSFVNAQIAYESKVFSSNSGSFDFKKIKTENATSEGTGKYSYLFLDLGARPLVHGGNAVSFRYVDESPSRDNLRTSFTLDPLKNIYGFRAGFLQGQTNHFGWQGDIGFAFGKKITSFSAFLGGGYDIQKNRLLIRPSLSAGFCHTSFKIGDVENNDVYIQVNDVKFYSKTASVYYTANAFLIKPEVLFSYPITPTYAIRFHIGYTLQVTGGEGGLDFSGQDQDKKNLSSTETLSAQNVYLSFNNNQYKDKSPFKYSGLNFGVGIALKL